MTPEQYEKARPDAASFTADAQRLFVQACPTIEDRPYFNKIIVEAKARGMTWVQGLRYVIHNRKGQIESVDDVG